MADLNTNINGQPVTLVDNGDGTYRIDLNSQQARAFIRDGELADLRAERDLEVEKRDQAVRDINDAVAKRDEAIAVRDAANARIVELNANLAELRDWVIAQGDSA
jgi:hypothetical protein